MYSPDRIRMPYSRGISFTVFPPQLVARGRATRYHRRTAAENGRRERGLTATRRGDEGVDFTPRRRAIIPSVIYEPRGEKMGVSRCKSNAKRSPSGYSPSSRRDAAAHPSLSRPRRLWQIRPFLRALLNDAFLAPRDVKSSRNNHVDERCESWYTITVYSVSLFFFL